MKAVRLAGGAGASVSAGADYQGRVAAYLLATALCGSTNGLARERVLTRIDFETGAAIDDLNLSFSDGSQAYIQAKRTLNYSTQRGSDLCGYLEQAARQISEDPESEAWLVTTSDASKRVTHDFRLALDAFRHVSHQQFARDHSQSVLSALEQARVVLELLASPDPESVLRRLWVTTLDVEKCSSLDQATVLLLDARSYVSPSLLHGRIVADCINSAALRLSISTVDLRQSLEPFRISSQVSEVQAQDAFLKVAMGSADLPAGKEILLGDAQLPGAERCAQAICEFYRYDDDCRERLTIEDGRCTLRNGTTIDIKRRTTTQEGMFRLIERDPSLLDERELLILSINSGEDFEASLCAAHHKALLRQAATTNSDPLICLSCEKYVGSEAADVVETRILGELRVGLVHAECLSWEHRVLGTAKSEFYLEHDYLVNFDVNGWYAAAMRGGQVGIHHAKTVKDGHPIIPWSGRQSPPSSGDYVVEYTVETGESEIAYHRGQAHRFRKSDAEAFATKLEGWIRAADDRGDPLVSSDQSRSFGARSVVTAQVGLTERCRAVTSARAVLYTRAIGERYNFAPNWYAPLAFLRARSTEEPFSINEHVVLLSNPLNLGRAIANWRSSSIWVPPYSIVSLLDDRSFDDFAATVFALDLRLVVDPVLAGFGGSELISGIVIQSLAKMEDEAALGSSSD